MSDERLWTFYIDDMLDFVQKAIAYCADLDRDTFAANTLVYDATLRNLELIGEAATRIPAAVRDGHPDIPWRQVIATRNRLIHGYLGIDDDILWSIIQGDLPKLREQLDTLRAAL
ncbi:nucleotidyltransferase [Pseudomonas oryzihabitans]|nr:nucleotidyltransferase [Pseudomonas psychrotolerans]KTT22420.1 nucleotidyltransferase [Pseudomonas psychrotolerans]KTT58142.1 nucleotidyltransferase [Pseudomonas psychrotolerans]